jgi:hypothetical protein
LTCGTFLQLVFAVFLHQLVKRFSQLPDQSLVVYFVQADSGHDHDIHGFRRARPGSEYFPAQSFYPVAFDCIPNFLFGNYQSKPRASSEVQPTQYKEVPGRYPIFCLFENATEFPGLQESTGAGVSVVRYLRPALLL